MHRYVYVPGMYLPLPSSPPCVYMKKVHMHIHTPVKGRGGGGGGGEWGVHIVRILDFEMENQDFIVCVNLIPLRFDFSF